MSRHLHRRHFIALAGGAAAVPLLARPAVHAQQALPVVGFLSSGAPDRDAYLVRAFRQGLGEAGFVEGQNVAVDYRWAENDYNRLPTLAADLVRRQVAAIVVNTPAAPVARAATTTIP